MFFNLKNLSLGVALLAIPTIAWDYRPPTWIASLPHQLSVGGAINKFHPVLRVDRGCVPFPAVIDAGSGWVSEGLGTTGAINGGCASSGGQVYARTMWIWGRYGIYYTWYFPKDQVALGPAGHRHDWEGVVVWATGAGDDANLIAICPARHGTGDGNYHCDKGNFALLYGNRPRIVYRPDGGSTHAVFTGQGETTGYGSQPLAFWDWMPQLCKDLLHWANFNKATPPILDWNFQDSMWASARAAGFA